MQQTVSQDDNDINNFIPSLINPRTQPRVGNFTLTQNSVVSRCSLSLKRNSLSFNVKKNLQKANKKVTEGANTGNKENVTANQQANKNKTDTNRRDWIQNKLDNCSVGLSAVEDLMDNNDSLLNASFGAEHEWSQAEQGPSQPGNELSQPGNELSWAEQEQHISKSIITIPSTSDVEKPNSNCHKRDDISDTSGSDCTESYSFTEHLHISVSLGFLDCENIDISTKNSNIKKLSLTHNGNSTRVNCEVVESSQVSDQQSDVEMAGKTKDISPSPRKRSTASVNLEIKNKPPEDLNIISLEGIENSKVLILNTNAIDRLSDVIVQPTNANYKLVKRKITDRRKLTNSTKKRRISFGPTVLCRDRFKQLRIDRYLLKNSDVKLCGTEKTVVNSSAKGLGNDVVMSRNLVRSAKCDQHRETASPRPLRPLPRRDSPKQPQHVKSSISDAQRVQSAGSPRKNVDSIQFNLPSKTPSNRTAFSPRPVPAYKIVTGTHFAVDAFSYGEIPNVKHYFLTHFHSDHYSGLKKTFSKLLFCSKITAELCVSRLGVNPKCIRIINYDETITVDNIVITAVDANHCPGALMLVFTLPSGKTLLHTGDFRASPLMESYPIFWNKDIHTIYLDTTYCNPRYDFPTQDQSLEMALYLLRQKKIALEKAGKKFSSVLIVCGTYTIGKEKFFLGMARRVGCSVWACPEKDRVLQAVEGRSFSHAPPHSCQLHVVPMRDLTHEKLHTYLSSLQGAFSEVVAFKPSGWENGKNSSVEKDCVTIHGIPYSEHSSFSEMIRFVKFLKPKQVVPCVDISGGAKAVQKFFPCPIVSKDSPDVQSKLTEFFSKQNQQPTAVT